MSTLQAEGAAVARAASLLELKRPEEALPLLARAIAAEPDNYRARCLMALALIHLGRHEDAVERAKDAVRVSPESEWAYRLLSVALRGIERPEAAADAARQSVALNPELAEGRIALAQALADLGRGREAALEANRAVELAPESPDAHASAGQVALSRGQLVQAERAFRRSLNLDPERAVVLNNLGVVLLRMDKREEAMQLFESSARADPRGDLGRRNLTATARRFLAAGGWASPLLATFVVIQIGRAIHLEGASETTAAGVVVGCVLLAVVLMWVYRRGRERELSPGALALLRDERRRMRRRPWTWEPSSRWVPWPIALLLAVPARVVAVLAGGVVVLMLVNSGGYRAGDWTAFACVVVFMAFFALRARDLPSRGD